MRAKRAQSKNEYDVWSVKFQQLSIRMIITILNKSPKGGHTPKNTHDNTHKLTPLKMRVKFKISIGGSI